MQWCVCNVAEVSMHRVGGNWQEHVLDKDNKTAKQRPRDVTGAWSRHP